MSKALKIIIVLSLMLGIVMFWFYHRELGIDGSAKLYLTGGGVSLTAFCVLYKLLGSWDFIPDWIPLLGGLDDKIAWLGMLLGIGVAGIGWYVF